MKKEILELAGPFAAALIGYIGAITFLAAFYITKDLVNVPLAFIALTVAPVPILVSFWDLLEKENINKVTQEIEGKYLK